MPEITLCYHFIEDNYDCEGSIRADLMYYDEKKHEKIGMDKERKNVSISVYKSEKKKIEGFINVFISKGE